MLLHPAEQPCREDNWIVVGQGRRHVITPMQLGTGMYPLTAAFAYALIMSGQLLPLS